MKRFLGFVGVLGVLVCVGVAGKTAYADTYVSDNICGTWTIDGSPYIIQNSIIIEQDATLRILPGVVVKSYSEKAIRVEGTLTAQGTAEQPITFSKYASDNWGYILFSDTSTDAVFDVNNNYISGSILEHCSIEYAGSSSVSNNGAVRINIASPYINYCTIKDNKASGICAWGLSGALRINNSIIKGNTGSGVNSSGGSIYITNSTIGSNTVSGVYGNTSVINIINSTISNNTTSGDGGGVYNYAFYGYGYTINITNSIIDNNTASGSGGGVYNYAYHYNSTINITNSTISNNITSGSGGGVCGGSVNNNDNGTTINIIDSTVSNNVASGGGGVYGFNNYGVCRINITDSTISNNTASGGGGGVLGSSINITKSVISSNTAKTGVAFYSTGGNNNIASSTVTSNEANDAQGTTIFINGNSTLNYNNIHNNSAVYELYNNNSETSPNVDAKYNWWGTTSEVEIQNKIYDWYDDSGKGRVIYKPYATQPWPWQYLPSYGTLSVTSSPTGANILINGTDTGRITPVELPLQVGSYTLTLTKTDYYPYTTLFIIGSGSVTYISATLTSLPLPLEITSASLPSGTVNTYYQVTLTATGGVLLYSWSYSGNLPSGLALASNTGLILGTPTQSGSFTFTAQVTDSVGSSTSRELSIYIASPPPVIGSVTVYDASGGFVGTYTTIQEGINACPNEGTVTVADGTYNGSLNKNLSWSGKHITVRSVNGVANCIIDCENSGRGFCFNSTGQNSSDVIDGFTIRNSNDSGIYCQNSSSPTITNCVITGNTAWNGGGICCHSSSPTITNCVITGNTANDCGGGIWCGWSASPTITNCIISGNTASSWGGGIYCWNNSSSLTITNCVISGNISNYGGGGICCTKSNSSTTITNCVITNNQTVADGGGIYCYKTSFHVITNCIITGNTAGNGGGISCEYSSPIITNCVISGNIAGNFGGGILCEHSSSPIITNCIISGNTATYGGGICCWNWPGYSSSPVIDYNNFWNNSAPDGPNYSDCSAGPNDISANPQFIAGDSDFHLGSSSPCINKGTNTAPAISLSDKDGNPRIVNGIVDMGAYEYQGILLSAQINITPISGTVGTVIIVAGTSYAANDVIIIAFGTNNNIQQATASTYGSFTAAFTVDTQVQGTTTITAGGISSAMCRFFINIETPPESPLTITAIYPENNERLVNVCTAIMATFSTSIKTTTVTSGTMFICKGTTSISGTYTFSMDNRRVTFIADQRLDGDATYTVTITDGVSSIDNNRLSATYTWQFTTTLPGDADSSGRVDGNDLMILGRAFGSNPANPCWNNVVNFEKDSQIDGNDLMVLGVYFGRKSIYYAPSGVSAIR
ncbi:MAG: right-handed parallel beta-helix repeat-containing protein [bacterium]